MRELDTFRHDVHGQGAGHRCRGRRWPTSTSARCPPDGAEHEPAVYMEDTMWPYEGKLLDYIDASGTRVRQVARAPRLGRAAVPRDRGRLPTRVRLARASARSTLMQRILDPDRLLGLLTTDIPAEMRAPGTWMHDALELRDRWESKLLRTAPWSPFPRPSEVAA